MGKLNIDLLTDSGVVRNIVTEVSGNQGVQWITQQIDLTPWSGQTVVVLFKGKTGNDFASDLALDDFQYFDNAQTPPTAGFTINSNTGSCTGDTIVFTSTSTGVISSYLWDFGLGASPQTASTAGPHKVVYSFGGTKQITLDVSNLGGINQANNSVVLESQPSTSFVYAIFGTTANFMDGSTANPTSWDWDFGDGNSSTLQNPSHTYASGGTYAVTLKATNACGSKEYVDSISLSSIDLNEAKLMAIALYPNPTEGVINLNIPSGLDADNIRVSDLSGRPILYRELGNNRTEITVDLRNLSEGIYMVELNTSSGTRTFRVIRK